jgi:hypothetical protein
MLEGGTWSSGRRPLSSLHMTYRVTASRDFSVDLFIDLAYRIIILRASSHCPSQLPAQDLACLTRPTPSGDESGLTTPHTSSILILSAHPSLSIYYSTAGITDTSGYFRLQLDILREPGTFTGNFGLRKKEFRTKKFRTKK